MTSVLYSGGLNYQRGNPVRSEIVEVRREVDSLRKAVELLTEENMMYKKYITKLLQATEDGTSEFTRDMQSLTEVKELSARSAGGATVQGGGFRR